MNNRKNSQQDQLDLEYVIYTIKKYWYIFGVCVFLGFCLAYLYTKIKLPIYEVGSSIFINTGENQSIQAASQIFEGLGILSDESSFQNEIEILKSTPLIRSAINNLDFQIAYFNKTIFNSQELYQNSPFIVVVNQSHPQPINTSFRVEILNNTTYNIKAKGRGTEIYNYRSDKVIQKLDKFKVNATGAFGSDIISENYSFKLILNENFNADDFRSRKFSFIIHDISGLVKYYQANVNVEPISLETTIARLKIESNVPSKAVDLITSIANEYLARDVEEKIHSAVKTIEYIDNQLGAITDSLRDAEMNLQQFRVTHQVLDISEQTGRVYDQLQELEREKGDIMLKLRYYEYINDYFVMNKELSDLIVPSSMGIEDALLNNLIQELTSLNAERSSLIENNQAKSPYLRQIEIRIDNLKNTISENIKYILNTTEITLQEIESQISSLNNEINKLPSTERELLEYERRFSLNDAIYTFLLERRAEAQIAQASFIPGAEVVEPTDIIGTGPIRPKKKIVLLIGTILGFVIPFASIRLKDILQNKITENTDVNGLVELPILGQVYKNNKKIELVVNNFPKSHIAESFRIIRTGLNYFLNNNESPILVITSSYGQEGKSFISNNLAVSLATTNKKTILIGFDLRKPKVFERLNIKNNIGVSSYLSNQAAIEDIIQKTNIDNLHVITSGPIPPNPSELIASNKTTVLLDSLRKSYCYVILDTPPVGILSDTFILMDNADLNIYVVRQYQTPRREFQAIIKDLKMKNFKNLCLVVNDVPLLKKSKYGYDYYER